MDVAFGHIFFNWSKTHSSRAMKNHFILSYNIVFLYHITTINSKQRIHELTIFSLWCFCLSQILDYFKICAVVLLHTRCLFSILEIFSQQGSFNLSTYFVCGKLEGWVISYCFNKSPFLRVRLGSWLNFININLITKPFTCLQIQQFTFVKLIFSQRWSYCCSYSNVVFYFGSYGKLHSWSLILYGTSSHPPKPGVEEDIQPTSVISTKAKNAGSTRKEPSPTSKPTEQGSLIFFLLHS